MERPDFRPRMRRSAIAIAALALGASSVVVTIALRRAPLAPVIITIPSAPAQTVTVPAPIVNVEVPPPPAPSPPPDKPTIVPRMLAPHLDADCLLPDKDGSTAPTPCSWDDGFPAVSADGTLVAVKQLAATPSDGSTTDVWIDLLDSKTARVVRQLKLLTSADVALDRARALSRVVTRVDAAQRVLDRYHFATLIALGSSRNEPGDADPSHVHAEFLGGQARIVDPVSATVLWQDALGVAPPGGVVKPPDDDSMCGSWNLHSTQLWWRPDTKVVLAELTYFTGGCMCPDDTEFQIWQR